LCAIDNGDKYAGVQLPVAVDQSDVSISSRVCALVGPAIDTGSVYNKMNAFCGQTKNKTMPACKFYNLAQFENNIKTTDAETRVFSRYDSLTPEQKTYAGIKDVIAEIDYMKKQEATGNVPEDNPLRYSTFNDDLRAGSLSSYSPICLTGSEMGELTNPSTLFPRPNSNYPKCNFNLTVCKVSVPMQDVTARNINTTVKQKCGSTNATTPPATTPPTGGGGGGGGTPGGGTPGGGTPGGGTPGGGTPDTSGDTDTPTTTTAPRTTTAAPRATSPPAEKDTLAKIKDFFQKKQFQNQPNWVWFAVGGGVFFFLILLFVASSSRGGGGWYRRRY